MEQELIEQLDTAFSSSTYPGDENIGDQYLSDFVGQTDWKQVSLEILQHNGSELPLFTPEAFHFYLPAYIKTVILYPETVTFDDSVIFNLSPAEPLVKKALERKITLFTKEQKAVILKFLQVYEKLYPQSAYVLLDESKLQLEHAITFWQSA